MNPTTRYEQQQGEWRADPPHVSYGSDRSGLVALLGEELRAGTWAVGARNAGPTLEVEGRTLRCPVIERDLEWLEGIAAPAPYGRGEETLLDPAVRNALQIGADDVSLGAAAWDAFRDEILCTVAADMGLADATLRLEPLKLLIYRAGGHLAEHADTEKTAGMIASLALIVPGQYEVGALVVEHGAERLRAGDGGSPCWRWVAWYADCRHRLEPVRQGVRLAMTFGVVLDGERPLTRREASRGGVSWAFWRRSYAEEHTAWAARGGRTKAGNEQYGQKLVWVLSHRYTEPGLRAPLLKGRDRELARTLLHACKGEACYLAWLQIRETGSAHTESGASWSDEEEYSWEEVEHETDLDPPPDLPCEEDDLSWTEDDTAPIRLGHRDTPELHLEDIARQNAWIEDLRSLQGELIQHGPIEVPDGEIVPRGALAHATPAGGRVYEATGNEGASLELQYRQAVLVLWRRNPATLRMLARCGGRLAFAVELAQRATDARRRGLAEGRIGDALSLWLEALECDGGGPEPRAHRLILEALQGDGVHQSAFLRWQYVESVAAVDLDAEAVPTLVGWVNESLEAGEAMDAWVRALRPACKDMSGTSWQLLPAVFRACAGRRPGPVAGAVRASADPGAGRRSAGRSTGAADHSQRPYSARWRGSRDGSPSMNGYAGAVRG